MNILVLVLVVLTVVSSHSGETGLVLVKIDYFPREWVVTKPYTFQVFPSLHMSASPFTFRTML